MANIRLAAFVALFIFLSFPPSSNCKAIRVKAKGNGLGKLVDVLSTAKDVVDLLFSHDKSTNPDDKPPMSITEAASIGFYTTFYVGNSPQSITARLSISDIITYFKNYQPASTYQCCTASLSCSRTNCNGRYSVLADTFTFEDGSLNTVPYKYDPGDLQNQTIGYLSFSRSPYSLLSNIAQSQMFSYYFSDSSSSFTIGDMPSTAALQYTRLLTIPDYPHLYDVKLTKIQIGASSYQIDPTTNSSRLILDTVIVPTLLETEVYVQVKTELLKLGTAFNDADSELELCFSNKPNWPDLTLYFPSSPSSPAGSQMVLKKNNYVVTASNSAQCAAIYESEGASVIGVMAQVSRQMAFDLSTSEPGVYFSQHASSGSNVAVPSMITILIWSLSALTCLYFTV